MIIPMALSNIERAELMCFCSRIVGVTQTCALGSGYLHGLNVQKCSPAANLPPYAGTKGTTTEVASHDAPSNVFLPVSPGQSNGSIEKGI